MRTLGPYRFERRLGAGGMGEVYLAFDHRLRRRVALKRLRADRRRAGARARLYREARALARLHHPSIVQCFDLLVLDDEEWLVMEYVEGPRLADLIADGDLPLARVVDYARQIAEGLAVAHARGLVHRDLKSENVVVDRATGRAKILDFGLVRTLDDREAGSDSTASGSTASGAVLGTVRAMAPEQALGLEVGPRADLFALGVLLYEMLTGRSPFGAASSTATLSRLLAQPPEPLPPETPHELADLTARLLEKAPEHRPSSAAGVANRLGRLAVSLEAAAVDEAVTRDRASAEETFDEFAWRTVGRPDSLPTRERDGGRRLAVATVAAGLLVASILALFLGFGSWLGADRRGIDGTAVDATAAEPVPSATVAREALRRYDRPGAIDRAIEIYKARIDAEADEAHAYSGLATAYWRKFLEDSGDAVWLEQAQAAASHAVELAGAVDERTAARTVLGLVLVQRGEHEAARTELERALELDPQSADAHRGLAEIHQAAGRDAAAEAAYRRALELRPRDRELYDLLAALHFRHGRLDAAEAASRRSIELAPDAIHGYRNLAGVHIARGELGEAAAVLESALEIRPAATLYLNLGTVFFHQGLYSRAAAAYEAALEHPYGVHYHVAWGNLGDAYRQVPARRDEAPRAYRQAIRLLEERLAADAEGGDGDPRSLSRLALYRAKAGLDRAARRSLESLRTGEPRSLLRAAIAWEILGERQRALDQLAAALAVGLDAAEVKHEPELLALRSDRRFHELVAPP